MGRAIGSAFLSSLLPAIASADVPVYPKRPEWDEVPLPMPPELALLLAAVLVVVALAVHRAWSRRG